MMRRIKKQLLKSGLLFQYHADINKAWAKDWVVYSQPSFSDADHVIGYLGLYTHRVAISNHRIVDIDEHSVRFSYKDYRDKAKTKILKLGGVEFLRRFSMHILPKGFVKVRYFGILSNRFSKQIAMYRKPDTRPAAENPQQRIKRLTGFDINHCPFCKKGKMHQVEIIPKIRSPDLFLIPKYTKPTN